MRILITGAAGIAGRAVARRLIETTDYAIRLADVVPPPAGLRERSEFVRCDTRTPADVDAAVAGCDGVIHLAAWHCAHKPPVSDETIFAVNVDGTFNVTQACRRHGVKAYVFASSMAFGWGGVYGVTKVIGEDLSRCFHEQTGAPTVNLRYHDFVPKPYLDFGRMLFRNGVDSRDVADATVRSIEACLARRVGLFTTVVHHQLGAPADVVDDFGRRGGEWLESQLRGAQALLAKHAIELTARLEQHDLSEAADRLGWRPTVNGLTFLRDLERRDAAGEDVSMLWADGRLPESVV